MDYEEYNEEAAQGMEVDDEQMAENGGMEVEEEEEDEPVTQEDAWAVIRWVYMRCASGLLMFIMVLADLLIWKRTVCQWIYLVPILRKRV